MRTYTYNAGTIRDAIWGPLVWDETKSFNFQFLHNLMWFYMLLKGCKPNFRQ